MPQHTAAYLVIPTVDTAVSDSSIDVKNLWGVATEGRLLLKPSERFGGWEKPLKDAVPWDLGVASVLGDLRSWAG